MCSARDPVCEVYGQFGEALLRSGRMGRKTRLALPLAVGLVSFLLAEGVFRLLEPQLGIDQAELASFRDFLREGRPLAYEPRAHTVFQRPRWWDTVNAWGFRGKNWRVERTPSVPRILCLGGSTTERQYPRQLAQILTARWRCEVEVLNAGVAGWTTAEAVVAWFLTLQDFRPDLVIIHFAVNDLAPRSVGGFLADYSHWRRPFVVDVPSFPLRWLLRVSDIGATLALRNQTGNIMILTSTKGGPPGEGVLEGRLAAATARPFRRNIETIGRSAQSLGAKVLLMTMPTHPEPSTPRTFVPGCEEHNSILRDLAQEHGWLLADAARLFEDRWEEVEPEFRDFVHLNPKGDLVKAELLADTIGAHLGESERQLPHDD